MLGDDMEYHAHSTCCSCLYNSYDNVANDAGRSCEIIYTNKCVYKYLFPWKIYIYFSFFNHLIVSLLSFDNGGGGMLILKKRKKRFWMEKKILTFWPVDTIRYSSKNKLRKLNRYESKQFRCRISSRRVNDNYIERQKWSNLLVINFDRMLFVYFERGVEKNRVDWSIPYWKNFRIFEIILKSMAIDEEID